MRRLMLALAVALTARASLAQTKIGYVDVQRAVQEVEEGKAARSRLKSELDQKRANLDQKRANLEKMKADYDKQAPVLSEDAKRKKQEDLQKAFIEAQNEAGQMQEELSGKEQEAMQNISKRLLAVVAEISDKENFSFVLDKAALLYAPAASDVTNEVVRRYNERFGSGPAGKAPDKTKPPEKKPGKK
ncbi:MAG: OmpH family outer membrane protein [Myxococcales bacterium]|nr:OmpH family outer membrane protein [Myxococcales bacterium]